MISTTVTLVLTMGGWVIAGVLGVLGFFDKGKRERRREDDEVASNLIKNLQATIDIQEKKLQICRNLWICIHLSEIKRCKHLEKN